MSCNSWNRWWLEKRLLAALNVNLCVESVCFLTSSKCYLVPWPFYYYANIGCSAGRIREYKEHEMGQPDNITVCKLCQRNFEKSEVGRIKILRREKKGESVLWVCSYCAGRIKFSDHWKRIYVLKAQFCPGLWFSLLKKISHILSSCFKPQDSFRPIDGF